MMPGGNKKKGAKDLFHPLLTLYLSAETITVYLTVV